MKKTICAVRRQAMALFSNEVFYLICALTFNCVFSSSLFFWYSDQTTMLCRFILIPWGSALCLVRLYRMGQSQEVSADMVLLAVLVVWMFVPFIMRFGLTYSNLNSAQGFMVAFFAVYAMTRETDAVRRGTLLDWLCAAIAFVAFVWGGILLLYAVTGRVFESLPGVERFGVVNGCLQAGEHYNNTGMNCVCMLMICLTGVCRRKSLPARLAHLIPAIMMMLVVVLTQSRTARYSMLLAFAVGVYGAVLAGFKTKRVVMRHIAAIAAAFAVLVVGFFAADAVTDRAIEHYNGTQPVVAQAAAEETVEETEQTQNQIEARGAFDSTFTGRVSIWNCLFELWKEQPKYLLIGNGAGRTARMLSERIGWNHKYGVMTHNTYLQFIADYGMIGMGILLLFFLTALVPVLRVFFAKGEQKYPGGRSLCMLIIAILVTGLMESQPLSAMSTMNLSLFYALAVLSAEGRAMKKA